MIPRRRLLHGLQMDGSLTTYSTSRVKNRWYKFGDIYHKEEEDERLVRCDGIRPIDDLLVWTASAAMMDRCALLCVTSMPSSGRLLA
jgi:hypothetical protein